ncbi:7340_t:CDS:2, partial [Acaulospora colombiana]
MADARLALRARIPVLTPQNNPHLVHQFLLNHIPEADLTGSNTLSNDDTLSPLIYALVTTPLSSHGWILFKFIQEQQLRVTTNAGVIALEPTSLNLFRFPPFSQFAIDTSRAVAQFWTSLNEME